MTLKIFQPMRRLYEESVRIRNKCFAWMAAREAEVLLHSVLRQFDSTNRFLKGDQ